MTFVFAGGLSMGVLAKLKGKPPIKYRQEEFDSSVFKEILTSVQVFSY